MSFKLPTKYLIFAIAILILALLAGGYYIGHRRGVNAQNALVRALNDTISTYQYKVGNLQKTAYEKDQLVLSQKQAIQTGLIEKAELRKLNLRVVSELTSLKGQIQILKDSIAHNGVVVHIPSGDTLEAWRESKDFCL